MVWWLVVECGLKAAMPLLYSWCVVRGAWCVLRGWRTKLTFNY